MEKRVVHVDIDDRTWTDADGINRGLEGLAAKAADSYDFEDILSYAIQSLFRAQPEGEENYSGNKPKVGRVWLSRLNNGEKGKVNLEYSPSLSYRKKWGYIQKTIGVVDLRKRTYLARWRDDGDDEFYWQIPPVTMKDTEKVMEALRLKRETI